MHFRIKKTPTSPSRPTRGPCPQTLTLCTRAPGSQPEAAAALPVLPLSLYSLSLPPLISYLSPLCSLSRSHEARRAEPSPAPAAALGRSAWPATPTPTASRELRRQATARPAPRRPVAEQRAGEPATTRKPRARARRLRPRANLGRPLRDALSEPPLRSESKRRATVVRLFLCVNGNHCFRFSFLPLFLSLETGALTPFGGRRRLSLSLADFFSPLSLSIKGTAELSPILPTQAHPIPLARQYTARHCRSLSFVAGVHGSRSSSPELRRPSSVVEPCSSPPGRKPVDPSPSHARTQG
jgi:hypothetical protein